MYVLEPVVLEGLDAVDSGRHRLGAGGAPPRSPRGMSGFWTRQVLQSSSRARTRSLHLERQLTLPHLRK